MIQHLSSRLQTLFVLVGLVILFGIAHTRKAKAEITLDEYERLSDR